MTDMPHAKWCATVQAFRRLSVALGLGVVLFVVCILLASAEPRLGVTVFFGGLAVLAWWALSGPTRKAMRTKSMRVCGYLLVSELALMAVLVALDLQAKWMIAIVSLTLSWVAGMLIRELAQQSDALPEKMRKAAAGRWKEFPTLMFIAAVAFVFEVPSVSLSQGVLTLAHIVVLSLSMLFLFQGHRALKGRVPAERSEDHFAL